MLTPFMQQWSQWILRDLAGNDAERLAILQRTWREAADSQNGTTLVSWDLCTRRNVYRFKLSMREPRGTPYFGCAAVSRCWRAGEDWHRGNDLPDGSFSEPLWLDILKAIVAYEIDTPVPRHEPRIVVND